ncbi:hypothetical protein JXA88_12225 [Candidatus Fermentibacteria bacterium]|nr:hypothetical protein [Candidatus Fermentibacteria bacterium]
MRLSLLLLFCSLCGGLAPLREAEPAPDLNDLAAWATARLDDGVSFEPETLWGDLSLLRILRDTVTVGLVYESLARHGCSRVPSVHLAASPPHVPPTTSWERRWCHLRPATQATGVPAIAESGCCSTH